MDFLDLRAMAIHITSEFELQNLVKLCVRFDTKARSTAPLHSLIAHFFQLVGARHA